MFVLLAACSAAPTSFPREVQLAPITGFPSPASLGAFSPAPIAAESPVTFRLGDGAVYGLRLVAGSAVEEWLVSLEVEKAAAPDLMTVHRFDLNGREVLIGTASVGLRATVHDREGRVVQSSTSFVGDAFLRAGSLEACDLVRASGWRTGTVAQPTDAEASILVRGVMGMYQLFGVLRENEALGPLLLRVVRRPSILSIVTNGGVTLLLEARLEEAVQVDPTPFGAPRAMRYPVRILANGTLALEAAFFVVAPQPPNHLSAGVVAIDAWHPDEPERRFTMRLLGGRRG